MLYLLKIACVNDMKGIEDECKGHGGTEAKGQGNV